LNATSTVAPRALHFLFSTVLQAILPEAMGHFVIKLAQFAMSIQFSGNRSLAAQSARGAHQCVHSMKGQYGENND
jgi:hypothetical protein